MFCKKSKFWNKVIHKSKNGVDCISDNENKHKDHHCILDDDDDDDDDDLNSCNPFTVIKILYDDNSPLDDQDYNHEDYVINSEYCSLINRIKSELLKNVSKGIKIMILILAVRNIITLQQQGKTKGNTLLAKFFKNLDWEKFCLNFFGNFQNKN